MAVSDAERAAAYRARKGGRVAELVAANVALQAGNEVLRAEVERLQSLVGAEAGRDVTTDCPHPAASIEEGVCRDCGEEQW